MLPRRLEPGVGEVVAEAEPLLNEVLGDDAFKRYSLKKQRHEGGFLLSLYETVGLGVAFNIASGTLCDKAKIAERARFLWRRGGQSPVRAREQWGGRRCTRCR